jgi:hypothetical protein
MAAVEEIAKHLVAAGRARDLHDLLTGVSPYCRVTPALPPAEQHTSNEGDAELWKSHRLWTLAVHHLDFVARHGRDQGEVWEGAILHCAYPEEFEQWLRAGAPGLSSDALTAYLHDHPLEGNGVIRPPTTESSSSAASPK